MLRRVLIAIARLVPKVSRSSALAPSPARTPRSSRPRAPAVGMRTHRGASARCTLARPRPSPSSARRAPWTSSPAARPRTADLSDVAPRRESANVGDMSHLPLCIYPCRIGLAIGAAAREFCSGPKGPGGPTGAGRLCLQRGACYGEHQLKICASRPCCVHQCGHLNEI